MMKNINYKKKKLFITSFFLVLFSFTNLFSENTFFKDGKYLFDKKDYKKAKFKFEQDIVFNPKSENAYLYLAKIFEVEKKSELEESNLNTVILLNPENEEAIYRLVKLNILKSNFSEAENLLKKFSGVCINLCGKNKELKKDLNNSLKK
jgi:tetratricopeptide (TPR) repeat protein